MPRYEIDPSRFEEEGDSDFAEPGGESALHAASRDNPRNLPCPTCRRPDMLTARDKADGYQCDACAKHAEGNGPNGAGEY